MFFAWPGQITVIDVENGTSQTVDIPELGAGDPPYGLIRREDRLVFWGSDTWVLDPDHPMAPPVKIADDSWFFVPSAKPDRVWVVVRDEGKGTPYHFYFDSVREISTDGTVMTKGPVPPPGDPWMEGAVDAGVVFQAEDGVIVWDPERQNTVAHLRGTNFTVGHGNVLAWSDDGQTIHFTDVITGQDREVSPPSGYSFFDAWEGQFSPDGSTFAVNVSQGRKWDDPGAAYLIDVASATGRKLVPGSLVDAGWSRLSWDPTGTRLYLARLGDEKYRQLAYWDVGDDQMTTVEVPVPEAFTMVAA